MIMNKLWNFGLSLKISNFLVKTKFVKKINTLLLYYNLLKYNILLH